ncbi:uncharacterized protein N7500_009091 [Penicillium coprophilum]|uniref:uncharacterized protein n=1 Tax=Penicillium coprophilum TaxID=36646 RepID=UPI00239C2BD1|nr:uncharacterized protein N7500_009091 [Penicillium coprophilum]KAJ5153652.1 hypothetical protein N7500_009091 [Penicillium coprophilum]
MKHVKALIFDFGNVLCTWILPNDGTIPPTKLKQIMSSDIWFDYERGRYTTAEDCYSNLEDRFAIRSKELDLVLEKARKSLKIQSATLEFLTKLKTEHPHLRVYGLTNTPLPEQDSVYSVASRWPVFDHIYISGNLGMRKPDISCYKAVLQDIGLPAEAVVFIDDLAENILSAQSIGIHSILFENHEQLARQLENVLGDPVKRGTDFLIANAKRMDSVTESGITIHENFAQLLILDVIGNRELVRLETWDRTWNYFIGKPCDRLICPSELTTGDFPNDLDTTSIALSIIPTEKSVLWSVMDEMLTFTNEDGIFMTYFDHSRPRVDPVVCVNILYLFCQHGREIEAARTFEWVLDVLRNRAYQAGSRYYPSPDVFLYFLTRLSRVVRDGSRREELLSLLQPRVTERIGTDGSVVSLSTRILACCSMGIVNHCDVPKLLALQSRDGGWPVDWIYKLGSSGLKVGNRGLNTALATKAIEASGAYVDPTLTESRAWWQFVDWQGCDNMLPFLKRKEFVIH